MPRVSIGLPVYNGERFLGEAIASLLGQTFADFELIISDNASTDGTQTICESYAARDPRIRYIRNPVNVGAGKNYNNVFELARGEYFKWSAHDDVCAPTFLEKCVAVLDRDPGVVIVYPQFVDIDEHGAHLVPRISSHIKRGERGRSEAVVERFRNLTRVDYTVEEIFGLMRSSVLRRTRLIQSYTDSDRTLLAELGLYGRLFEIPEVLFFHRLHKQMSTQVFTDWQARTAWFDPAKAGRPVFPLWRQYNEYIRSVFRSPLRPGERIHCLFYVCVRGVQRRRMIYRELRKGIAAAWQMRKHRASGSAGPA